MGWFGTINASSLTAATGQPGLIADAIWPAGRGWFNARRLHSSNNYNSPSTGRTCTTVAVTASPYGQPVRRQGSTSVAGKADAGNGRPT